MYLPKPISDFLAFAEIEPAYGGMSSADIYRCRIPGKQNQRKENISVVPDKALKEAAFAEGSERCADAEVCYLKIEPWSASVEKEHGLYGWLYEGKRLPVPEPLFCVSEEMPADAASPEKGRKYGFLLIREAKGEILRTPKYYADPARLARLAAKGLELLWQVETADCPVKVNLDEKLKLAQEGLQRGGYGKLDASVPYTKDFKNHAEVFAFLVKNQPDVKPVFTHGDYCLNNFFTDGEHVTAFIDFGNGGVGDAYQDIALCIREFIKRCPEAIPYFYEQLGIKDPDEEKLRYYMLLDELF